MHARTDITNAIDRFTNRRIREGSREFARVEFAKDHSHEGYAGGWVHNGYTADWDSRIDVHHVAVDSRTDSQWVHKGSHPMFTVHRREFVYGI